MGASGGGMQQIGSLASGIGGIMQIGQGASFQAASLRSAIPSVYGAANFNMGVVRVNLSRQMEHLTKTMTRTLSTQRAQAASSGLSVASKSFQALSIETAEAGLNAARNARQNAHIEQQRIWYDAVTRATALENQARAAEAAGRAQQSQAFRSLLSSFG
jgi:hypothetical protein